MRIQGLAAILAIGAGLPATAQQAYDCVMEPFMVLQIGSSVEGLVEETSMTRGGMVKAGDVLARLESTVERQSLALSEAQARSTLAVDIAESRVELALKEVERARELSARQVGTQSNLDLAEAQYRQAVLELAQAREDQTLLQYEVDRARAILDRRTVRSPIDGILLRQLIGPGEYVYSQAQIAQIATIDPLYVDVFLPTSLYDAVSVGQMGTVRPADPIGGVYQAEITAIDQVFDAASDTFGLRLTLPNPGNKLPAGVDCTVEFSGS